MRSYPCAALGAIAHYADSHPNAPALIEPDGEAFSYHELWQQIEAVSEKLQGAGVGTGDNPPDQGNGVKKDYALKTAEMYKDIWGHLPESMRQEMSQYTREQFMAKYNDLLKQYYATIAEKGRKQSDR